MSAEQRAELIGAFLARAGWGGAKRRMLAGDASFRRYERLTGANGQTAVLMDAPPHLGEDCRPFVAVGEYLRSLGFSAPEILAADLPRGLLLLEDLGDDLYARLLAGGGDEALLYGEAVDLLLALHAAPAPRELPLADSVFGVPLYSGDRLQAEADLLPDWYLPELHGRRLEPDQRAEYVALWRDLMPIMTSPAPVLVLRDYHAENLLWLPGRQGLARVGLLDYQDAVLGHPAYDLISLLSDARRDVPAGVAGAILARYTDEARQSDPRFDPEAFTTAFAVLGAQRNCKIIGIFTRLWRRDGKPAYLQLLPRVWRNLESQLVHPALAPLKAWLDRLVPAEARLQPLPARERSIP